ncbi:hypothetical protein SESBI_08066 [Sesbania bispinosa]|nr:hypothetical protein SESBI_08066 [Sesbania bispinosa]
MVVTWLGYDLAVGWTCNDEERNVVDPNGRSAAETGRHDSGRDWVSSFWFDFQ